MRASLAVRVLGGLVLLPGLAGCGGDDGSGAAGPGPAAELAERAGLDGDAAVGAICDGWETGQPDHPTVNQYVHDLLLPLDLIDSGDRPADTEDDIAAAVADACQEPRGEPEAFVRAVRDDLGLSEADLQARVDAACARHERQRGRITAGDSSEQDLSQFLRDFASMRGVALAQLSAAVAGVCRGS
jgi:hypothetical protein